MIENTKATISALHTGRKKRKGWKGDGSLDGMERDEGVGELCDVHNLCGFTAN